METLYAPVSDEELPDRVVTGLREALGDRLQAVVLYGSRARGDHHPGSDWDLLVIAEDLPSKWWDRHQLVNRALPIEVRGSVAILSKTPDQFDSHLPELYLDIALDGKVLYERDGFASQRLEKLRGIMDRAGLYRESTPIGLIWNWRTPPRQPWSIEWDQ